MTFRPLDALRAVRDHAPPPELTAVDKIVLVMLVLRADPNGASYPSQSRLARDTGLSRRAVQLALVKLQNAGVIEVRRRLREGTNEKETSIYRVKIQVSASSDADVGIDAPVERSLPVVMPMTTPVADSNGRGKRIQENWRPSQGTIMWASRRGVDAVASVGEFIDFWMSAAGPSARKVDWDRAFKNRLRKLIDNGRALPLPPTEWHPSTAIGTPEGAARARSIMENLATARSAKGLAKAVNHG